MVMESTPTPERRALLEELAREILHHYGRGRRLVGVDGAERDRAARFADELAAALRGQGATAARSAFSASTFPAGLAAFRSGPGDGILVLDGPVLGTAAADALAWAVWLDMDGPGIGGPGVRTSADAIVDDTDPARPVRRFSDWCVVPRR